MDDLKAEITYPTLTNERLRRLIEAAQDKGGRLILTIPEASDEDWKDAEHLEEYGELTILHTEMAIDASRPE